MSAEYLIAFLGGSIIAMICSMQSVGRAVLRQQHILAKGALARGTVIRLWQPPLQGTFARIYFEFQPGGAERPIRTWHVDRRSCEDWAASLPSIGADVAVRYLPENPSQAVIVKLVSRFRP